MKRDVLWLDDDTAKLKVVGDLLRGRDFTITYADSVAAGLAALESGKFSTLILDAIVPLDRKVAGQSLLEPGPDSKEDVGPSRAPREGATEVALESSYANLERGGLRFQELARDKGVVFDNVIVVSYVPKNVLADIGYSFDMHIDKPSLPDQLGSLASFIEVGARRVKGES